MNYKAVQGEPLIAGGPTWFITFADGPHVGTRHSLLAYTDESKAKRRIRDLKAKEALKTPIPAEVAELQAAARASVQARVETQVRGVSRQVGCYPHVSKRAYLR